MKGKETKFLGKTLVERGLLTEKELSRALDIQQVTGKPLGHILIELGLVNEDQMSQILGKSLDFSAKKVILREIPQEVIEKVPASVVQTYKVIPIEFKNNVLTLAMADPFNLRIIDDLHFRLGYEIKGVMSNMQDIQRLIDRYYGEKGSSLEEVLGEIKKEVSETVPQEVLEKEEDLDVASLKEMATQAPVVKLLNLILLQAIKDRASDIHFEPFETEFKVRYRVDGVLYELTPPPKSLALPLTSRIKVMSSLDIAERRLPQDGRIQVKVEGRYIDLRVSSLPTVHGESVVLRVLDKSVVLLSLDHLGMGAEALKEIRRLIAKPNGIILVTGPTGSGKTTTLYSALREINSEGLKLITTEDPVEYEIEGIIQIPINPKINLGFARCLRSILRQDPDVIMVGEIRDEETAEIAVQASLTGHLVLSTLHTNDAPGALTRLLDMGIEPFLITSSLEAVLAQRLVRTICADCKESYNPPEDLLREIGFSPQLVEGKVFYRGRGCKKCNHSGYRGRTAIFELFLMQDVVRQLILERAPTVAIRAKAQELGMVTLRADGLVKVLEGITTVEEVLRETIQYL